MRVLVFCTKHPYMPVAVFHITPFITLISAVCPLNKSIKMLKLCIFHAYLASSTTMHMETLFCWGSLVLCGFSRTTQHKLVSQWLASSSFI